MGIGCGVRNYGNGNGSGNGDGNGNGNGNGNGYGDGYGNGDGNGNGVLILKTFEGLPVFYLLCNFCFRHFV